MWQPAFGLHNLMNRHILKPPSICQLSYRLHKQNWRLLHFWVFVKVLHTQMHRLLLCLDDKNPFEKNLLRVIWCLKPHMPKHKPVTPSNGSHPDLQSLDYRLMLHVDMLVVLCTSVVAHFWRLQLIRNWCTSSSVSVHTQFITPEMLTGKANRTRAVIWQPLNYYPSLRRVCARTKPKPLRHRKSQVKWRKRELSEVG